MRRTALLLAAAAVGLAGCAGQNRQAATRTSTAPTTTANLSALYAGPGPSGIPMCQPTFARYSHNGGDIVVQVSFPGAAVLNVTPVPSAAGTPVDGQIIPYGHAGATVHIPAGTVPPDEVDIYIQSDHGKPNCAAPRT